MGVTKMPAACKACFVPQDECGLQPVLKQPGLYAIGMA